MQEQQLARALSWMGGRGLERRRFGWLGLCGALFVILALAACNDQTPRQLDHHQWDVDSERTLTYLFEYTTGFDRPEGPATERVRYVLRLLGGGRVRITEDDAILGDYTIASSGELVPLPSGPRAPARLDLLAILPESGSPSAWTRDYPSMSEVDAAPDRLIVQSRVDFATTSIGPAGHAISEKGFLRIVPNEGGLGFLGSLMGSPPPFLFEWHLSMVGAGLFSRGRLDHYERTLELPPAGGYAAPEAILASPHRSVIKVQLQSEGP